MDRGIQRIYRNKYPELLSIKGKIETMIQHSRVISDQQEREVTRRRIIKIKLNNNTEEEVWNSLELLRNETMCDQKIALHSIEHIDDTILQKMAECIYKGKETEIRIYTNKSPNKEQKTSRKTYALMVEATKENYKDKLKEVKNVLNSSTAASMVNKIRTTRDGQILIITQNNEDKVKELSKALNDKKQIKHKIMRDRKLVSLNLKGMDEDTNTQDILADIKRIVRNKEDIQVGKIRPNARRTLAVTVKMESTDAEILAKRGIVRIGLNNCSITKYVKVKRCSRCWSYSHNREKCNPQEKQKTCYACGSSEHIERNCERGAYCPNCEEEGHKTYTSKCKTFRKELAKEIKNEKRNTRAGLQKTQTIIDNNREEWNYITHNKTISINMGTDSEIYSQRESNIEMTEDEDEENEDEGTDMEETMIERNNRKDEVKTITDCDRNRL